MTQNIQIHSDNFTIFFVPRFPKLTKYRYIVYNMKFSHITNIISVTEKNYVVICGDFTVEKSRFRLLGKLPWNYIREKRMVSQFQIPIQSSQTWLYIEKIGRLAGIW